MDLRTSAPICTVDTYMYIGALKTSRASSDFVILAIVRPSRFNTDSDLALGL